MSQVDTAILIILDGFGLSEPSRTNAVSQADTPNLDRIFSKYPFTQLDASAGEVGLPLGVMGNSEVGHLNIGAGRVVHQDLSRISNEIETGEFFSNPTFKECFTQLKEAKGKTLHLMGLLSDGGVHSHLNHLFAVLQMAKREGVAKVSIHAILDGRDTAPTSGIGYLKKLQAFCSDLKLGEITTIMGRFYAMDRDKRWERTEKAYQAIVEGKGEGSFKDPIEWIQSQYDANQTDEFILPYCAQGHRGIQDKDAVLFFNYRADRARQITMALGNDDFDHFGRPKIPSLSSFVTFTQYDESFTTQVAFRKDAPKMTLGEFVATQGWNQLRIAETEKYAHVTYFFNGGEEKEFEGETRVLIPSPREVNTYDEKPEMSAKELTTRLLDELDANDYQLVVVNYANCDMVGHTGNIPAAVKAVEAVDESLGHLVNWIENNKAFAILTADHGNCEQMVDETGKPLTSHTLQPVPFVVINSTNSIKLKPKGRLCDIAPTLIDLWHLDAPVEMSGKSLLT